MDLYLELPIDDNGNKFVISNEKTKEIDDDQVFLNLIIHNQEIFSFKDSFAFEIGDIIYRWLETEEIDINYSGSNFLVDFIVNEEKWDTETPIDIKVKEKSEYSKYWLFSSHNIDIFSFSNNNKRFLIVTERIFEKNKGKIIYQTIITRDKLLLLMMIIVLY